MLAVTRFGEHHEEFSDVSDDDGYTEKKTGKPINLNDPKSWTLTEKTRFERCLMLFGFAGWETIVGKHDDVFSFVYCFRVFPPSINRRPKGSCSANHSSLY